MDQALDLAESALNLGELPIAAIVVLNGEVLAQAHTEERSQKRLLVHAELLALEEADKLQPFPGNRSDVQLFTTLEPCLMCFGAAMSFGVGEIHYALESASDGAINLIQSWQRDEEAMPSYRVPQVCQHIGSARDRSIELFRDYVDRQEPGPMRDWAMTLIQK